MEFDFSGNFVNVENVKKGDICTITAVPYAEEKESATQKELNDKGVLVAKKYMVMNIPVEINGKAKNYTPDVLTGKLFQAHWGKDSDLWVGKQFSVDIEEYKAFGTNKKRVIGFPID